MTMTVADAAVLLTAMAGADPADPATEAAAGARLRLRRRSSTRPPSTARASASGGRDRKAADAATIAVLEAALAALRRAGAQVVGPGRADRRGQVRRARVRGPDARVQARHQRVPGRARRRASGRSGRADRVQHQQRGPRAGALRPGIVRARPRRPAVIWPIPTTSKRGPPRPGWPASGLDARVRRITTWTRSSR